MPQYIDKSTVVSEIDKLLDKGRYHEEYDCAYRDGNNGTLYALKSKLNILDVKDVNLEKEIKEEYLKLKDWKTIYEKKRTPKKVKLKKDSGGTY